MMDLYGTMITKIIFKRREKYESFVTHIIMNKRKFELINENMINYDGCIVVYDPSIEDEADIILD